MDEEERVFLEENFRVKPRFCRRSKVVGTTAFLEGKMIPTAGVAMKSDGARRIRPEAAEGGDCSGGGAVAAHGALRGVPA